MDLKCTFLPSDDELATAFFREIKKQQSHLRETNPGLVVEWIRHPPAQKYWIYVTSDTDSSLEKVFELCLPCLTPHIESLCDGRVKVTYHRCARHSSSPTKLSAKGHEFQRSVVPAPYVIMWLAHKQGICAKLFAPGVDEQEREREMFEVLKPRRLHTKGCFFSAEPEVCVIGIVRDLEGKRVGGGGLTRSLYFKRCDGAFRNLGGEIDC